MCGGHGEDKTLLYSGEAASSSLSTQLCVIDAFAAYGDNVRIDKLPREVPWDTTEVKKQYKDEQDPYCDFELIQAAVAQVQKLYFERKGCPSWWTNKSYFCLNKTHSSDINSTANFSADPKLVLNEFSKPQFIHNNELCFELPPHSAFLQTDLLPIGNNELADGMKEVYRFVDRVGGLDILLIDPPWPNVSASRARHGSTRETKAKRSCHGYQTLEDIYDLWRLRSTIEPLLRKKPLVAIWITNHPKVRHFVKNKFLPGLQLKYLGAWAWLKLAQNGYPLYTLAHPRRRRPYELLVLAGCESVRVPEHRIITSVALAHSQKPYVIGVYSVDMEAYADLLLESLNRQRADAVVVELFARHTPRAPGTNGWHLSIGNEPLRFNTCAK